MVPRGHIAAAWMVVRPLHRLELALDVEFPAGFEKQDLQAARREHVGGHAAGRAGTDNDGVVCDAKIRGGLSLWKDAQQRHACSPVNVASVYTRHRCAGRAARGRIPESRFRVG